MPEQSQKVRSSRPLKLYAVAVTAIMLLILAAFLVVFTHAGYHTKVLVKLGLKEPVVKTNHALLAWENCLEKLDYDADVVFFGDSITYQSDFQHPGLKIVNLGYSGDTLSGIARAKGVSLNSLCRANGLRPDSDLKIGQQLRIPEK